MKPTVELIGADGRIIWVQAVDKTFQVPPGRWRLRSSEPFPPDGYRVVGHGGANSVTLEIDIAQRMLDWQAAIRQSNGGKDTPLSDACGEAAKELERLRAPWQPIATAPKVDASELLLWEGIVSIGYWSDFKRNWQTADGEGVRQADPTHWMPKPAPPEGES